MKSGKKILFFLPGLDVGGAERHTLDLRNRLRDRGYDTSVISYGPRCSERMLQMPGAEGVTRLNIRGMSDAKGWVKAYAALKAGDFDIILGVNQTPAIVAAALRTVGATRAKVGCIFHTTLLRPNETKQLPLFRAVARSFDALVFVSANQARYWGDNWLSARRVRTIVNGVDPERFEAAPADNTSAKQALGFAADDYVIGQLAAIRPEKNHMQVVEAIVRLRADNVPAKGLFVGDGPLRADLEARAARLGISQHLVFAGEQGDVRPYIAAFDVGVLPSTAVETFSLAALELLSCGVPVVLSNIGGASEIVEDGVNGFLFEAGSLEQFVERLNRMADTSVRMRMKSQARASVRKYSMERMVAAYEDLITELSE